LVFCLLGMTAAQPNGATGQLERAAVTASEPCGALAGTASHVRSVVLVMMENHATPVLGSMPYLHARAAGCARAAGYHAITHPSLPNYLALTSGRIPSGIRGRDCKARWQLPVARSEHLRADPRELAGVGAGDDPPVPAPDDRTLRDPPYGSSLLRADR
jgi:hypothetical protein